MVFYTTIANNIKRAQNLIFGCASLTFLFCVLLYPIQIAHAAASKPSFERTLTFSCADDMPTETALSIIRSMLYLQTLRDAHKDLASNKVLSFGIKEDFMQMALISQLYTPNFQVENLENEPRGDKKMSITLKQDSTNLSEDMSKHLGEKTLLDMRLEWLTLVQENAKKGEDYLLIASGIRQSALEPPAIVAKANDVAKTLDALWLLDTALKNFYERWHEPKKVEELLLKAIKINDKLPLIWACLGEVQLQLDAPAKALESVNKSLSLQADRGYALYIRGLGHLRLQQPSMAKVDFDAALALEPDTVPWLRARGATLMFLEQYDLMCKDFNKACSLGDCEGLMTARKRKLCLPQSPSKKK